MMLVLVCGSRNWTDGKAIAARLEQLPHRTKIMHGGARGADQIAAAIATGLGFRILEYPADWRNGRGAGLVRNLLMLDQEPDLVIAFQRDNSTGTQHVVDEARKRGIPVEVHVQ